MVFPFPSFSPGASLDEWELISNEASTSYPAGLQDGDIALLMEAVHYGGAASDPGTLPLPTGATDLATQVSAAIDVGGKEASIRRAVGRVCYRAVGSAQSSASAGFQAPSSGSIAQRIARVLIFRCTIPGTTPSATAVGAAGTAASFSSSVDFSAQPLPPLPGMATARTRSSFTVPVPTVEFDSVGMTLYSVANTIGYARTARADVAVRTGDASQGTVLMTVSSVADDLRRHQPFTLAKG